MFLKHKYFFVLVQDIISKWRSIRDNYVRSLKKQAENCKSCSGAKKIKLYIYGKQLSFLKKNKELQHTDGSLEDNIQKVIQYKEINDTEEDIELSVHGTSTSTVSKTKIVGASHYFVRFFIIIT